MMVVSMNASPGIRSYLWESPTWTFILVHPIKEPMLCYPPLNLGRASSFSHQ